MAVHFVKQLALLIKKKVSWREWDRTETKSSWATSNLGLGTYRGQVVAIFLLLERAAVVVTICYLVPYCPLEGPHRQHYWSCLSLASSTLRLSVRLRSQPLLLPELHLLLPLLCIVVWLWTVCSIGFFSTALLTKMGWIRRSCPDFSCWVYFVYTKVWCSLAACL